MSLQLEIDYQEPFFVEMLHPLTKNYYLHLQIFANLEQIRNIAFLVLKKYIELLCVGSWQAFINCKINSKWLSISFMVCVFSIYFSQESCHKNIKPVC